MLHWLRVRSRRRQSLNTRDLDKLVAAILITYSRLHPPDYDVIERVYQGLQSAKSQTDMRAIVERDPVVALPGVMEPLQSTLLAVVPPSELLNQRQRLVWLSAASKQFRDSIVPAIERLIRAHVWHQIREAVEDFPLLRSEFFRDIYHDYCAQCLPEDYRVMLDYQLRWIRDCYGKPSPFQSLSIRSGEPLFPSIAAGLSFLIPDRETLTKWSKEAESAFLWATSLRDMRAVATYFPVLLRPAVSGGIDVSIELEADPKRRAEYSQKLRHLQKLQEEALGHPVESWWRTASRTQGVDIPGILSDRRRRLHDHPS
jgi:hypothetical protein